MMLTLDDRRQIDDLVAGYAHLVDAREFERIGDLFVPDAVLTAPDPPDEMGPVRACGGRSAIVDELSRLGAFAVTYHALAGAVVSTTGPGRARGSVKCVAHHVMSAGKGAADLTWHLRYTDEYDHSTGRWLIADRAITIDLIDLHPVKRARPRPFEA
ncbi:nuclear transport factor 2 family protein [Gordonia liuliyuniae]|uniref:Nuclear transport factor 2 family protein n=1 Tax=Gordonia liuliyuniae TaxID=2911517 RepID=A0ABS9ITG3_9ACTN|nr:nuclear transport factor 2 family protein [Gordonia liuliyuniae]MCF8588844.1 nuclear transport factor 2 family protein [Gordonia liuliyuniae]